MKRSSAAQLHVRVRRARRRSKLFGEGKGAMRRRFRADAKGAKTRRRKAVAPRPKKLPKAARDSTASVDGREAELARELHNAQEQLTTTAEILEVIRGSLDDTQPVFDAIVRSGARLFPGAAVSIAL